MIEPGHRAHDARRSLLKALAAMPMLTLPSAWAQGGNVVKLVVPFTPGASNDTIGRMLAEAVSKRSVTKWIVENKPGAGSMLGAEFVAQSAPDGNTLLLCATANMGILPAIQKNMRYAVDRDFTFLVRIASSPFALTVGAQLPVSNFADFVRLAKAKPGSIRLGSAGVGSLDYMGASLLKSLLDLDLNIIPYKGMSGVLNDLRAGHIEAAIVSPATVKPLAQEASVKVLAVLDKRRSDVLPSVPSSTELGQPQLLVANWWGIAGPAKMPAGVVAALRQQLMAVLTDSTFLAALKDKGFDPAVQVGDGFTQFVLADLEAWAVLAKRANITAE